MATCFSTAACKYDSFATRSHGKALFEWARRRDVMYATCKTWRRKNAVEHTDQGYIDVQLNPYD